MSEKKHGIVERIKAAKTSTELAMLVSEVREYPQISAKTLRRAMRAAKVRGASLKGAV